MAFDFTENITIELPSTNDGLVKFVENEISDKKKLIIELAAIHEGLTSNYNHYSASELEASLDSWVQPYPKPIILNHDQHSNAIGRVMAARMDKEGEDSPFVRLQVAIMDPQAIERVMDQRYLTGSVGGKAKTAKCSVCQKDWAQANMFEAPCKHARGKVYNGKLAFFELGQLSFKEYSFVNIPADQKSRILGSTISSGSSDESEWTHKASIFAVDMDQTSILEFGNEEGPINILESMTKKKAHATYMNIKGTWLTTSAYDLSEKENDEIVETCTTIDEEVSNTDLSTHDIKAEENNMSEHVEENSAVDDILDVFEELEDAPASSSDEEVDSNLEEEDTSDDTDESTEEVEEQEVSDDDTDEIVEEEVSNESETVDEQEVVEEDDEQLVEDHEQEEVSHEQAETESDENTPSIEELINENAMLKERNSKLEALLHKTLAEKVVDAKIAVGILSQEERAEALEDHIGRSPSSLRDSLRDLARQPKIVATPAEMETRLIATGPEPIFGEEEETVKRNPKQKLEDTLVDALSGRRYL